MKKTSKKLIPAIAMLVITAILLTTASYAWFTMSREVTATGMNVKVTAPTNLLISNASDGTYAASATNETAATTINPASSIDGSDGSFWALKNGSSVVAASGKRLDDSLFVKVGSTDDYKAADYYQDFTYYVKTEGGTAVNVYVKSIDVTRNGGTATDDGLKAVRAAVISDNADAKRVVPADGYKYATPSKAIKTVQTSEKVIAADLADVALEDDSTVFTCAANGAVKTVTVRVWFEGEDEMCNVDKAANLDFNVELVLADLTTKPTTVSKS